MSTEVTLPALGESVTEGTVSRWLKQVGEAVAADEAIVEVSTDKVDTEIPSPVAGTLLEIRVPEDEACDVGGVLAVIGDPSESASDGGGGDDAPAEAIEEPPADQAPAEVAEPATPSTEKDAPAKAPAASTGTSGGKTEGTEVTLPALGESVTEGTVARWLKQVGDSVEADEAIVEVSTDKVDTEIPSPVAGTVLEIRVAEDDVCEVGGVLAVIGDASAQPAAEPEAQAPAPEPTSEPEPQAQPEPEARPKPQAQPESEPKQAEPVAQEASARADAAPASAPSSPAHAAESSDEVGYVTPLVRKLAAENNVNLSEVTGTGVGGRIRKQDVMAAADAAKQAAAAPAPTSAAASAPAAPATAVAKAQPSEQAAALRGTTEKMSRLRATIAKRMVESLQTSAQLTATVEVDLTAISRLRAQVKDDFKRREGASLSYLPFITKATVEALKQFPKVNASIDTEAGTITYSDAEHIGIAVDTERGLLVPVIKDAGDLNLAGLAKKIADLAARTRASKVTPDELSGGTFTITNYGSAGTLFDTPIVNQPQVAILGTGALVKRPVVVEDTFGGETIAIRHMMYLSMSYDHRLVDGADAARFLQTVKTRLEEGDFAGEI